MLSSPPRRCSGAGAAAHSQAAPGGRGQNAVGARPGPSLAASALLTYLGEGPKSAGHTSHCPCLVILFQPPLWLARSLEHCLPKPRRNFPKRAAWHEQFLLALCCRSRTLPNGHRCSSPYFVIIHQENSHLKQVFTRAQDITGSHLKWS